MSNDTTLDITCEDTDVITSEIEEVEETLQQLAEWTLDDVF